MSEDTKKTDTQWVHIDALMKAGGQITLGRMAPLNNVAVAADDHEIYAILERGTEESVAAFLHRLDQAIGVAKCGGPRTTEIDDKRYVLSRPTTRRRR
jgi:hypothetical protein